MRDDRSLCAQCDEASKGSSHRTKLKEALLSVDLKALSQEVDGRVPMWAIVSIVKTCLALLEDDPTRSIT